MLTTNASLTTGFESWSSSFSGEVWTKMPTIGSARNASVTPATATRKRNPIVRLIPPALLLHAREETEVVQLPLAALAEHALDERVRSRLVRAAGDGADAVLHLRLRPGGDLDHEHL